MPLVILNNITLFLRVLGIWGISYFTFSSGETLFPEDPKTVMMNNNAKQLKSRPGACTSDDPASSQLFRSVERLEEKDEALY